MTQGAKIKEIVQLRSRESASWPCYKPLEIKEIPSGALVAQMEAPRSIAATASR
jgi:hypothetical protein